jgi:acetoacetyl-CoA synthetase
MTRILDSVREYFHVIGEGFDGPALAEERMPSGVVPNAKLNFAENVLRHARTRPGRFHGHPDHPEDDSVTELTWRQLESQVSSLAAHLRRLGIGSGDRVAAALPNVPEAIIGLLATAAIGAVWTISSPDLSPAATLERLRQLEPKLLIGVDGYRFNGKDFDRLQHLSDLETGLPGLEHTILLRNTGQETAAPTDRLDFSSLLNDPAEPATRVPF